MLQNARGMGLTTIDARAGDVSDWQFLVLEDCAVPVAEGLALAMPGRPGAAVDMLMPLRAEMRAPGGAPWVPGKVAAWRWWSARRPAPQAYPGLLLRHIQACSSGALQA